MKYVRLDDTVNGVDGVINPGVYLRELPGFASELPRGARAFATDPGHYDIGAARRCVKDLRLERLGFDGDGLEIFFRHNCWKHDEDLTIRYTDLTGITADLAPSGGAPEVVLDEVLPHASGCSHEIACREGTIQVTAHDLTATWTPADCPDLRRE